MEGWVNWKLRMLYKVGKRVWTFLKIGNGVSVKTFFHFCIFIFNVALYFVWP
jgi:hypothetical protein